MKKLEPGTVKEQLRGLPKWQYDDERVRTMYDRLIRESGLVMRQAVL